MKERRVPVGFPIDNNDFLYDRLRVTDGGRDVEVL